MSLDQFEFLRVKQVLVPSLVPWLRELRAGGNDARVVAKQRFDSPARVGLNVRFGLTEGGVSPDEFNQMIDCAMLAL
jgi:hypothetical protein